MNYETSIKKAITKAFLNDQKGNTCIALLNSWENINEECNFYDGPLEQFTQNSVIWSLSKPYLQKLGIHNINDPRSIGPQLQNISSLALCTAVMNAFIIHPTATKQTFIQMHPFVVKSIYEALMEQLCNDEIIDEDEYENDNIVPLVSQETFVKELIKTIEREGECKIDPLYFINICP